MASLKYAFLLALTTSMICLAAESPEPQAIVNHAREAWSGLKNFEIGVTVTTQTVGPEFEQTMKSKLLIAAGEPRKLRIESKGSGGVTIVSDGNETWTYQFFLKQYTKTPISQPLDKALASSSANGLLPGDQTVPSQWSSSLRLIGEEDLSIQGASHPCYVVQRTMDGKGHATAGPQKTITKFWIEKSSWLTLKSQTEQRLPNWPPTGTDVDMKITMAIETLKLGEAPRADLFTFTPPADAKLVDQFEYSGMKKSDLEGKAAADFELRDLSNHAVRLSDLRGKVVLLDFWATWCGPCQAEMPILEQIHQQHKGLVMLGIDVGEGEEVVRNFVIDKKITFPILLAGNEPVVGSFEARGLPTVVIIDKNGTIRAHSTGYGPGSEAQLLAAIDKAGKAGPIVASAEPSGVPTYHVGNGVSAPQIISRTEPAYSDEALKARLQGSVVLSVTVETDGTPAGIRVIRPLGSGLDEKAVEAVQKWRFHPGLKDGKPVAVAANIEIHFRLLDRPDSASGRAAPGGEPESAEEAYRRASRLIRERRVDEGIDLYGKAIEMKPDWGAAWAARGRAQYQKKRYDEAISDLDRAIKLGPEDASWYDYRGLSYSYSHRHERALDDYSKAIAIAPDRSPNYYNNRGWAYAELNQPEKALPDLDRAIRMAPDYIRPYENRAKAHMELGEYKAAIEDLTAAIELAPAPSQYTRRAEARAASGDAAGAEADRQMAAQFPGPEPAPQSVP